MVDPLARIAISDFLGVVKCRLRFLYLWNEGFLEEFLFKWKDFTQELLIQSSKFNVFGEDSLILLSLYFQLGLESFDLFD